jgi:hypothetical protein
VVDLGERAAAQQTAELVLVEQALTLLVAHPLLLLSMASMRTRRQQQRNPQPIPNGRRRPRPQGA